MIYKKVLFSDEDYLVRYHCANSLIELSGLHQFKPVELAGDSIPNLQENLTEFFKLIEEKLLVSPDCCGEGEPDINNNLILLDSTCILNSQFSASGYFEIWECQKCHRKWGITIYRDGSCRNADPPEWIEIKEPSA